MPSSPGAQTGREAGEDRASGTHLQALLQGAVGSKPGPRVEGRKDFGSFPVKPPCSPWQPFLLGSACTAGEGPRDLGMRLGTAGPSSLQGCATPTPPPHDLLWPMLVAACPLNPDCASQLEEC